MTSLLNFMNTYTLVQKLLVRGGDRQTDWWSDNASFHFFKESRLKRGAFFTGESQSLPGASK